MNNFIMRKISFLKDKILIIGAVFAALSCKAAYAAFPIAGLATLPVLGMMGAGSAGAKGTLSYAQRVLGFVEIFLILATIVLLVGSGIYVWKSLRRIKKTRKFGRLIDLLSCLQSDLAVIKASQTQAGLKQVQLQESKNRLIADLLNGLDGRFFAKNINGNLLKRVTGLLKRMRQDEISLDNQMLFVDKWLYKFAFLAK